MKDDVWIWIPGWFADDDDGDRERGEGFQHYKDRDPIWIKNYTRLLSHDAYMDLSLARRGILHGTWMEYARSARRLRGDTLTLTRRIGQRVSRRDIEALSHAGFIELIASDVLAIRLQAASDPLALTRARALARGREEKNTPPTPPLEGGNGYRRLTIKELRRYTGCKATRGSHGAGFKRDPLGTDKPPPDWPHPKPSREQVEAALAAQATPPAHAYPDEPPVD